jgi:hypothetical protein
LEAVEKGKQKRKNGDRQARCLHHNDTDKQTQHWENEMKYTHRILMLLVLVLLPARSSAEMIPPQGTVEGYYHRDTLGVGRFRYLYVSPDLHKTLAPYEGKPIRIFAKRIVQRMNPGTGVIMEVGKIERLKELPVKIEIVTRPKTVVAGQPFQLLAYFTDTRAPNARGSEWIRLSFACLYTPQPKGDAATEKRKNEPSWFCPGYKRSQFAMVRRLPIDLHWNMSDRSRLRFKPGQRQLVVLDIPGGIVTQGGELRIQGGYDHGGKLRAIDIWKPLVVSPKAAPAPVKKTTLQAERVKFSRPTHSELLSFAGLRTMIFRLKPRSETTPWVTRCEVYGKEYWASLSELQAFDATGKRVALWVHRAARQISVDETSFPSVLPKEGVLIQTQFRKPGFAPAIKTFKLRVLTGSGIEMVVLTDQYQDPEDYGSVPFGPVFEGVKLRVRPHRKIFKAGEQLIFRSEAMNVSKVTVYWWNSSSGVGATGKIYIDGKELVLPAEKADYIIGWGSKRLMTTPKEMTVRLPKSVKLALGKHTLRYEITSPGGFYRNANGPPLLKGTIKSNTISFTIEQTATTSPTK